MGTDLTKIEDYQSRDPAQIGWPPTLPIEVALKTASMGEIREAYGYTPEEWMKLRDEPAFLADLAAAVEMVKTEGMSFKLKSRLQAEELLKTSWQLVHNADTPASVRADLIKSTVRWAGYDAKDAAPSTGTGFNIQINLG
jgi:hypothetical protein